MNNLDYQNLNSLRNYPLADSCSRVSDDGIFVIPNTLIVDISLCSSGNDKLPLYISRIVNNSLHLLIEVSANGYGVFGTFDVTLPTTQTNFDVTMTANELFPNASGVITIGSVADLEDAANGEFTFDYERTKLLMRTYAPITFGVSWMTFTDTKGNTSAYTGYVKLQANSNLRFHNISDVLTMDAGENLGLNRTCTGPTTPVRTINGVGPDPTTGNFTFVADECVSFDQTQYGLVLSDSCGKPCVGCAEIEQLTTQVNSMENAILDIRNFANNLQAAIDQAQTLISFQCNC